MYVKKVLLVLLLMCGFSGAHAATTTLTTYYPAPTGDYDQITAENVGIGTTAGLARLTVAGSGTNLLVGEIGGMAGLVGLSVNGTLNSSSYSLAGSLASGLYINTPAGKAIRFSIGGAEKMALISTGNLGIGTDAPTQKLEVVGTVKGTAAAFGGVVDITAGGIDLTGGDLTVQAGNVSVTTGNISTTLGSIGTASGDIYTSNGTITGNTLVARTFGGGPGVVQFLGGGVNSASISYADTLGLDVVVNGVSAMDIDGLGNLHFGQDLLVNQQLTVVGNFIANSDVEMGGSVGIGGAAGTEKLTVYGNAGMQNINAQDITANAYYHSSDRNLKDRIYPLTGALAKVMRLQGVTYAFKTAPERARLGLIAQEVEGVIPEVVSEMKDGHKGVEYSDLVAVLVEALRDQQSQIDALRSDIQVLQPKL